MDVFAAVLVLTAIAGFIWFLDWLIGEWQQLLADWEVEARDPNTDARAVAMIPEFAAAVRVPDYDGPCRCRACRERPFEPCSDYDGD